VGSEARAGCNQRDSFLGQLSCPLQQHTARSGRQAAGSSKFCYTQVATYLCRRAVLALGVVQRLAKRRAESAGGKRREKKGGKPLINTFLTGAQRPVESLTSSCAPFFSIPFLSVIELLQGTQTVATTMADSGELSRRVDALYNLRDHFFETYTVAQAGTKDETVEKEMRAVVAAVDAALGMCLVTASGCYWYSPLLPSEDSCVV
jgi:hypothetical protein